MNLHGDMQVETKISKTSSGAKALLLKILDPNVPEKKKGEVVPRAHSRNSGETGVWPDLATAGQEEKPK